MVIRRTILILAWVLLIRFAGSADAQSVTLAWDPDSETNLAGYNIYRSEQSGAFTSLPLNGTTLVTTTSFTDSNVQNDRTYYYAVTAVSTTGVESAHSSEVQAETTVPAVITNGYARIESRDDGPKGSGLAIVGFRRGGVLVSEAAFPTCAPIQNGRIYAEIQNPVNTGIAISNPNADPVALDFYFTNASGSRIYSGSTLIAGNAQMVRFLNEFPFAPPASVDLQSMRTFTFSASLPMSFTAIRGLTNERSEFLMTNLPIAAVDSPELSSVAVPYYIDGGAFKSRIVLVNPTDHPVSGVVEFFLRDTSSNTGSPGASSGDPAQSSSYLIPASSAVMIERSQAESESAGWIRVLSSFGSPSPSVVLLVSFQAGGITVSDTGMTAVPERSAFRVYAEASGKPGDTGSVRTGFAISNSAPTPVVVRLDLLALDGTPTGLIGYATVPRLGQVILFLDQVEGFRSFQAPFSGLVRISGVPVTVLGLKRRYNERGDLLLIPIPALPESGLASSSGMVFFANGAGYSTQFIAFGSSAKVVLPPE